MLRIWNCFILRSEAWNVQKISINWTEEKSLCNCALDELILFSLGSYHTTIRALLRCPIKILPRQTNGTLNNWNFSKFETSSCPKISMDFFWTRAVGGAHFRYENRRAKHLHFQYTISSSLDNILSAPPFSAKQEIHWRISRGRGD